MAHRPPHDGARLRLGHLQHQGRCGHWCVDVRPRLQLFRLRSQRGADGPLAARDHTVDELDPMRSNAARHRSHAALSPRRAAHGEDRGGPEGAPRRDRVMKKPLLCVFVLLSSALAADLTVQKWHGNAIGYSGYRTGQNPQLNRYPTQAQILEDLKILERNWKLIRLYGSDQHSQDVLEVIRRERIGLKVMLGVWLDGRPGREGENATQIATGIRLANSYKDI